MEIIQSKQNASIKTARKLLQRKHRKTSYLIEGWHLFEEAKASGAHILQIFVLEEMADRVANMSKVKLVSPEVLKELCETQTPQGIVAEVAKQSQALPEPLSGKYLLLEDVQDPYNVGTIIRTADAAGFDCVVTSAKTADIYNEKVLRGSMGSVFHLPVYQVESLLDYVQQLKNQSITIIGTSLTGSSLWEREPLSGSFAIVMGNESKGMSHEMGECCDILLKIPILGQAESLNVATAAGIIMYDLVRDLK